MAIEKSKGKARPTHPRASNLHLAPMADAGSQRSGHRDAKGRFAPGNGVGRGRGWVIAVHKIIAKAAGDDVARAVAADAWKIFSATVKELPDDGPTSRGLAALKARHEALAAFWNTHAAVCGLTTDAGIAAQNEATKHGQRAERLTVTMLDVSSRIALAKQQQRPLGSAAVAERMQQILEDRRQRSTQPNDDEGTDDGTTEESTPR